MKHKYEIKQFLILLCILKLYKKSNWHQVVLKQGQGKRPNLSWKS